jgi:hypothetical protein
VGHVESRFSFGDNVSFDARSAWFMLDVSLAHKSFWTHTMVPRGDEAQVKACFGPFSDSAILDAR